MLTIPLDIFVLGNAGLLLRAPDLNRPAKHSHVFVEPGVETAADDLIGMVAKLVINRGRRIAGDVGPGLPDLLEGPEIFTRKRIVALVIVWTQDHTAKRMEGNAAGDIWMVGDK